MAIKIAINGFGRIGRQVTKALFEKYRGEFDLVAVNDLSDVETNAHLFKYDSNYGIFAGDVTVDGGDIVIDGDRVKVANMRGAFKGVARISDDVNPGIVVATLGYWRQLNEGTVNSISSAEFTDMGHAPSFSDNLVQVSRAN